MGEKIVLVTAGGHIASFHAAMKKMHEVLTSTGSDFELIGAEGGLSGLVNGDFLPIDPDHLEEDRAGSLIGADRKIVDVGQIAQSVSNNNIYAVVMMGGDNHLGEAQKCYEAGINIVGFPKTMDGDLSSNVTLGYDSAVFVGAESTRLHHNSAITNRRVFYVGLFGRNTDWTVCATTAYGGGDRGIPAEKEYEWGQIWDLIDISVKENKERYGVEFAVVPYSEGAKISGVNPPPGDHVSYDAHMLPKLQPEWIGMELVRLTKNEGTGAAFEAHTYSMRDFPPTKTDIKLARMAGEECINMILDNDFGNSAVFEPKDDFYTTGRAPLNKVAQQRNLAPTGFFDYDTLRPNDSFAEAYNRLFVPSLGSIPHKDDLVYKPMREFRQFSGHT
tara:strand:- start:17 stop:1180 length:1164 start_codon:yes stop_codon:yes gene_type:complete